MLRQSRTYRCEALVLTSFGLGEADLLVTFYTKELGKLRATAKGIRKPTSKMVGHLEPLNQVELALYRGKTLDTINQAQVLESFSSLKDRLEGVCSGIYLAELVDGFGTEGNPNTPLYTLLIETLRYLSHNPYEELPNRYFELHLLKNSGFAPQIYHCVQCQQTLIPGQHTFSPDLGGTLCSQCIPTNAVIRRLSVQVLKVLRFLDRSQLKDLPQLKISSHISQELKELLAVTIRYWIDREIRSKNFLEHVQRPQHVGA